MKISLGILARNEERRIEATIQSLLAQSVFSTASSLINRIDWDLFVVANGCNDRTALRAVEAFCRFEPLTNPNQVRWHVHEVSKAGKSNAWNQFVHVLASKESDFYIFMDGDIRFANDHTIERTLQALFTSPIAHVAVDTPLKDASARPRRNFLEGISVKVSAVRLKNSSVAIAGSFYCAKGEIIRKLWLPEGLPVEDGFIAACVTTDGFREPPNSARIVRAEGAAHYYETVINISALFRHELRLIIGTAINCYLAWDFLTFAIGPNGPAVGEFLRQRIDSNPNWLNALIGNATLVRGRWALPGGMLLKGFAHGSGNSFSHKVSTKIVALLSFFWRLPILIVANSILRRKGGVGFW